MATLDHLLDSLQVKVLVAQRGVVGNAWPVAEHLLPCHKIYYTYRGAGGYSVEQRTVEIRPGELSVLQAQRRNRCWQDPGSGLEKLWIHFDARLLGLVDLFEVVPCPERLPLRPADGILELLEDLVAEYGASRPFRALALNGLLCQALARILRKTAGTQEGGGAAALRGPGDRLGAVLQFIGSQYAKQLTLADLARVVHLQPTYFSNLFRKATGTAPMAFLQRFRVERAKDLLATTDLSVLEVARRVGFSDPYHFSRVFKRLAGSPPSLFHASVRQAGSGAPGRSDR